jgi:DNA-binding protein YbaB
MTTPHVRDPHEWMREQEQRTAALLAKAEQAKAALAENVVTHVSSDGLVCLQVNPGGALTSLEIAQSAERIPMTRLAAVIMSTYGQATTAAAARTVEIMSELTGPNSDSLEFLKSTLPQPAEAEVDQAPPAAPPQPGQPAPAPHPDDEVFDGIEWHTDATPPPTPAPPPRPAKPEAAAPPDDDFGPANWRS